MPDVSLAGKERKREKKKKAFRINQKPETKCSQKNVFFLSVRLFLKVRLSVTAIVEELIVSAPGTGFTCRHTGNRFPDGRDGARVATPCLFFAFW